MKYNIKDFSKKDFEVKLFIGHDTFFIVSTVDNKCVYLHRDGTLKDHCGDPNFFDTRAEAFAHLNRIFLEGVFEEELFEI